MSTTDTKYSHVPLTPTPHDFPHPLTSSLTLKGLVRAEDMYFSRARALVSFRHAPTTTRCRLAIGD